MKKHLVIFDLDNTLVTTRPAAKEAYKQSIYRIAKKAGIYEKRDKLLTHWKRIVQQVMGESKPHLRRFEHSLGILLQEHQLPDSFLSEGLQVYQRELLKRLKPQKGAKELLSWLKEEGHTILVATGSERAEAVKKLKETDLFQYIDALVTPNETGTMKPHPDFYQKALELTGFAKEEAIVIGDSNKEDIQPAKKFGFKAIMVPPQMFHLSALKEKLILLFDQKES